MTSAYSELYLDDAMCSLGEMCSYAIDDCKLDTDIFYDVFLASTICAQFEKGNPKYITGKSGTELAREVWYQMTGERLLQEPSLCVDRSPEYWAGWSLAYYQWYRNETFLNLSNHGMNLSKAISMYILHEADVTKFVDAVDQIVELHSDHETSRLKRLRMYYGYTQKVLSEKSGVTLRMIQLYEQGQNDLAKAQAQVVRALAQTLNCKMEDLL
jgi:DNA-binding transcriptional regulator YiaG